MIMLLSSFMFIFIDFNLNENEEKHLKGVPRFALFNDKHKLKSERPHSLELIRARTYH